MISAEDAIAFARDNFPVAPELLADRMGVLLRESPMKGCDGWCLTANDRFIIRLNSNLPSTRKRFTLAHELGHLILGVPTVVGETYEDMLRSDSAEERRVNELASSILLPEDVVRDLAGDIPVVAAALRRLATQAGVSELAAAVRVCNLAERIGLVNASVVLFDGTDVRWQWSRSLRMSNETAAKLLGEARKTSPLAFRYEQKDGRVAVASFVENPYFGTATLFVQLLPRDLGMTLSPLERRKQLEATLFGEDKKLQQRVSGLMGAHKPRVAGLSVDAAVALFWDRNEAKLENTALVSDEGREYVRLRIDSFCSASG